MKLYIRNMVCSRCIAVVKNELINAGFLPSSVSMGEAEITQELTQEQLTSLNDKLKAHGFELIDDKRSKLVEQIKNIVIQQIHHSEEKLKINYSDLLSQKLNKDYSALSKLFSEMEGITIEQYIILQKTERVKEFLAYDELSLTQIADELGYSSVAHLSSQFKKVTGLTPSQFKTMRDNMRNALDNVHP